MTTRYQGIEYDQNNAVVAGAKIYVLEQDGATLATLTDDHGNALANPVTSDSLGAFYFNADANIYVLQHRVNGRLVLIEFVANGVPLYYAFPGQLVVDAEAAAATATADAARTAADRVQTGLDRTASAASAAAAALAAGTYATEALGRAAVADAAYFRVTGDGTNSAVLVYRRDSSSASTLIATYPSLAFMQSIAMTVTDPQRPSATGNTATVAPKVLEYVDTTGKRRVADADIKRLNGVKPRALGYGFRPQVAALLSTVMFMPVEGQSLAQETQGGGPLVPTQIGRPKGWRYATNNPSYTTDLLDAISGSAVTDGLNPQGDPKDFPGLALGPHLYEMLARDHGIAAGDINLMPLTACNALGSQAIAQFAKGATYYQRTISQVQPSKDLATANGQPVICPGVMFCQGEADQTGTFAAYKTALTTKATNQAADIRAILTGTDDVTRDQTFDPMLFASTTCSGAGGTARFPVTRATLQAAIDFYLGASTSPVVHTTPLYHLPYIYDPTGVHCESTGTYLIGAYAVQAVKRVVMDEWDGVPLSQRFPPMFIKSIRRIGNSVVLKIQRRHDSAKLQWGVSAIADGYGIAEQENYGWAIYDTSANRAIAAPQITAPDEIVLTVSSGSMSDGLLVNYGLTQLVRNHGYFGGASGHEKGTGGNMCDDFGEYAFSEVVGCPMNNWLSPQGIVLDASTAGFARYTTQTI